MQAFLDYVAGEVSEDSFVKKLVSAVEKAKKNREWRHEHMTLLMRDQENMEKGIEQGTERGIITMIENALRTTASIEQTSRLLKRNEEKVREIAKYKEIFMAEKY